MSEHSNDDVLRLVDTGWDCCRNLFTPTGLVISQVADGELIPGSHWGDDEAGLIKQVLYARNDTPIHSVLHEGCHWLLMTDERRQALHTDAKGSALEESAVCYLQVLLSEYLPGVGRERMFRDMDAWGYSFRSGSTQRWFLEDAEDALAYLTDKLPHLHAIPGLAARFPSH